MWAPSPSGKRLHAVRVPRARALPTASFPPRLAAAQLPSARSSRHRGLQRTSTSKSRPARLSPCGCQCNPKNQDSTGRHARHTHGGYAAGPACTAGPRSLEGGTRRNCPRHGPSRDLTRLRLRPTRHVGCVRLQRAGCRGSVRRLIPIPSRRPSAEDFALRAKMPAAPRRLRRRPRLHGGA